MVLRTGGSTAERHIAGIIEGGVFNGVRVRTKRNGRKIEKGCVSSSMISLTRPAAFNRQGDPYYPARRPMQYGVIYGCRIHGCMWARILPGRPDLDRRTIRVLVQSLWFKNLTARQRVHGSMFFAE